MEAHLYQFNKISFFFILLIPMVLGQGTRIGFYAASCPLAEAIVQSTVKVHFQTNPRIAPSLLRMHFHDCFVEGCDGSILIDGAGTEKTAPPNRPIIGYEVIDDAKSQIEQACPGVVSCADILALAARDAVVLTGGIGWLVPTGRRDGNVSLASNTANLPGFREPVDVQKQKFLAKGLDTQDFVALVGGHTIGSSQCQFFQYRMYSFNATSTVDPAINPSFIPELQSLCPSNGDPTKRVALDTGSENQFDNSYFANLQKGQGILESDQMLWTDPSTRTVVQQFLGISGLVGLTFNVEFAKSMVKMSNIEVKTGTAGEIRKICSVIN